MTKPRDVAVHALRTIALSLGLGLGLLLAVYLIIYIGSAHLPIGVTVTVALFLLLVFVVCTAVFLGRRHAVWAPVFDVLEEVQWADRGEAMVTAIERAKIDAAIYDGMDAVRSRVLRMSVYRSRGRRRTKRVAVGDAATYLGRYGDRLWFLVGDRYHSGRIGLVGYDYAQLQVTFHLEGALELAGKKKRASGPVVHLNGPDGRFEVDLRQPGTSIRPLIRYF